MKKLFTTLAILSLTVIAQAAHPFQSALAITSVDGSLLTVSIDRAPFSNVSTNIYSDRLRAGNHYVKVMRLTGHPHRPVYRTVFAGYLFIPEESEVMAEVNRSRFRITGSRPFDYAPQVYEDPHYYPQHLRCEVDAYEFDQMIQSLGNYNFESTRMTVAKQLINNNYFSSRQVARLMQQMTFESSKLELAKYAYSKTVDKSNYFIVNDQFSFESSITALSDYIALRN